MGKVKIGSCMKVVHLNLNCRFHVHRSKSCTSLSCSQ